MKTVIRHVTPPDAPAWKTLRCALWPDGAEEHATEIAAFFARSLREPQAVLLALNDNSKIIAFAELSIRDDIPGLHGKKTGYVEGLYVISSARGLGITRKLLRVSQDWVRKHGCPVFASGRAERIVIDRKFR